MFSSTSLPSAMLAATPAAQALRCASVIRTWSLAPGVDNARPERGDEVARPTWQAPKPASITLSSVQKQNPFWQDGPAPGWAASPLWPRGTRAYGAQADSQPNPGQQEQRQDGPQAQQQQQPSGPQARPPNDVVYMGPLSQQHKLLKRISITNTLVAVGAAPAIVAFADNISMISRYGLATSLVFFGLITTGALHWVAHPYVHELRYSAATGQIDVRTTTLLGNSRWHTFNVDDVQPLPWNRPVATFTALGQFYYIDVYSFPDEDLLRRLTPDAEDVPKGYKDKEEDDD